METLLEAIRAATAADANEQAKATGAAACRTLLTALETKEGQPLVAPLASDSPVQAAAMVLRGLSPDQLLDLAIARLKAALPADAQVQPTRALNVQMVHIPHGVKR